MPSAVTRIASWLDMPPNLIVAAVLVTAGLAAGSIVRWVRLRRAAADERRRKLGSLTVWWVLLVLVAFIAWGGAVAAGAAFALVSTVGLREYFRLLDRRGVPPQGRGWIYAAVPITYAAAVGNVEGLWIGGLVFVVIGVTLRLVVGGMTAGFLTTAALLVWGYLTIVFFPSHAVRLMNVSLTDSPAGAAGWFVWLVVFTESDDIFQALWGRQFGRRKIAPRISPGKTWEGFLLGGLTAVGIGIALAPLLTTMWEACRFRVGEREVYLPGLGAAAAGVVLWIAGFFGDLNMSALKRDVGVKDTGNWIPNQGGILDRVDSLLFTAPAFYYLVRYVYG